jgi:hypothetical protein
VPAIGRFDVRTTGWEVDISSEQYRCPPLCASCLGPSQASVEIGSARATGARERQYIRLLMPYCHACAARVRWGGRMMMLLFSVVTLAALVLPVLVLAFSGGGPGMKAAGAAVAVVVGIIAALVLTPWQPPLPATARREAVWISRYDHKGIGLFCTNRAWAEKVAAANRSSVRETSTLRMMGPVAMTWTAVVAVGAVLAVGDVAGKGAAHPGPGARAPAARPAPAAAPPARRR